MESSPLVVGFATVLGVVVRRHAAVRARRRGMSAVATPAGQRGIAAPRQRSHLSLGARHPPDQVGCRPAQLCERSVRCDPGWAIRRQWCHTCAVLLSQGSGASCAGGGGAVYNVVPRRACGLGWCGRYGPMTLQHFVLAACECSDL